MNLRHKKSPLKKNYRNYFIVFILISISLLASASYSSNDKRQKTDIPDQIMEKINRIIEDEIAEWDITGGIIAIQYKGESIVTKGIGYRDEPNQLKVNTHTGFRIGSATKPFTALSIMQLVEKGKISLDDSIFKYLPDYQPERLPGVKPDNRIRDLLTHHNGIPSYWLKDFYIEKPSLKPLRNLPKALSKDYLIENRREVWAYTNAGFSLAGLIVERVSGMPFDAYVRKHIFAPLEMDDAHVFLPEHLENIALSHRKHLSEKLYENAQIPAASIIASASDMQKFMKALIETWHDETSDLIGEKTFKQMATCQNEGVLYDVSNFMGLGIGVKEHRGYKNLWHTGDVRSFSGLLQIIPELEMGAFVSTNGYESQSFATTLIPKILDALMDFEIGPVRASKKEAPPLIGSKKVLPLTGNFIFGDDNLIVALTQQGTKSIITLFDHKNEYEFQLKSTAPNSWEIMNHPLTLHYTNQYQGYYLKDPSFSITFNLMPLKEYPPTAHWDQFLNRIYTCPVSLYKKVSLRLEYSKKYKVYFTHVTFDVGNEPMFFKQHILSDTLLKVQGKGRNTGLVTQFVGKNTVLFSGLTLKASEKRFYPKLKKRL